MIEGCARAEGRGARAEEGAGSILGAAGIAPLAIPRLTEPQRIGLLHEAGLFQDPYYGSPKPKTQVVLCRLGLMAMPGGEAIDNYLRPAAVVYSARVTPYGREVAAAIARAERSALLEAGHV